MRHKQEIALFRSEEEFNTYLQQLTEASDPTLDPEEEEPIVGQPIVTEDPLVQQVQS